MKHRYFFYIAPEFAPEFASSRRWVVTVKDLNGRIRGVVICDNKLGLLDALEQAIPDDDEGLDIIFDEN